MKYALVGYGKMGRAIEARADARGHRRVAVVAGSAEAAGGYAALGDAGAEVAFEFTDARAAERNVLGLLERGVPVVCGTTGWEPGPALSRAVEAAGVGVVLAPNFSVGMNLFLRVAAHAARLFAPLDLYDVALHEAHHRAKRDVPSGTARRLAALLVEADPRLERVVEGNPPGALPAGALHVSSTRVGAEPGTHTVWFDGEHDRITLAHGARGREAFAVGAVLAAEWLPGRRGLHSFDAVLDELLSRTIDFGGRGRTGSG